MLLDDKIYQAFLEEMDALERFRSSHTLLYRDTPLELVEDPDTTRLLEAIAFFSARCRLHGQNRIGQIHQLLFRQYFSFLVNPLPAMGLLQIQPSLKIPEQMKVPEETEIACNTYDGRKAIFQALETTEVFPLFLQDFGFYRKLHKGWRLEMTYALPHTTKSELEKLTFYINHLNSFLGSLRVYFALNRSIEGVFVCYDQPNTKNRTGIPCDYYFGRPQHHKVFNHPLERIRSRLHFPEQELFMTINIPASQAKWQTVTIYLDLDEKWPENLTLTKEALVPYVVPIVNLKLDRADPIECDGMKDGYFIMHPNPTHQFKLHTVLNVSEVLPGGLRPLKPGILDSLGNTYEIDFLGEQVFLDFPDAFVRPRIVSVEAFWTQLWFADYIDQEFKIRFVEDFFSDLKISLVQQMRSHEISAMASDPNFLIKILSLKNQNNLNLSEVLFLMNCLKNLNHSFFKTVPLLIKDLEVIQQLDRIGLGPTICYQFQLNEWDGRGWEVIVLFFKYLTDFLNCWLSNFHVETKVLFPHIKTPLIFKGEIEDELSILARDFYLP